MNLQLDTKQEEWWPKFHESAKRATPYDYCKDLFTDMVKSGEKQAMVFTLEPNHSFIILINEKGESLLLNSHLHYKDDFTNFEEALQREGNGAALLYTPHSSFDELLLFIFDKYPGITHTTTPKGEMIQVCPKN